MRASSVTSSDIEQKTRYGGLTWLPMPSRKSMKKKRADQSGASGMRLRARGYTMNAKPGPVTHSHTYVPNTAGEWGLGGGYT